MNTGILQRRYLIGTLTNTWQVAAPTLEQAIDKAALMIFANAGAEIYIYDRMARKGTRRHLRKVIRCTGEAHSNGHIDHCAMCMPYWGVIVTAMGGQAA